MAELIARLWRLRWALALAALAGFVFGFQDAHAQEKNCSLTNPQNVPGYCDQGEAFVSAMRTAGVLMADLIAVGNYEVQVNPGNYQSQTVYAVTFMETGYPPEQTHSRHSYISLCTARDPLMGMTSPGQGPACWFGCQYWVTLEPEMPVYLTPAGPVCAEGNTAVPAEPEPEPDPCDENPEQPGCPGYVEPEDPEEPGDDSGGTGGSYSGGGGGFPGGGGNPGGSGHPGAGSGGPGGEGAGQLCGGPNQPPCNMTLGEATLPSGCDEPPACAGDPVGCGILFTTWRTACNGGEQPEWTKVEGDGTEGLDAEPEGPVRTVGFDPASRLDQSGFGGGGGSCPSLGTVVFKVGTLSASVDFDSLGWWCPLLTLVRQFNILMGAFIAIRIILGDARA